jgi:hypothetical protein
MELLSTTFFRSSLRGTAPGWAALLCLACLCGCGGPTSLTSLRQNPHSVISFEAPAACETVYQRITRRAQEQYRYINLATYQPGVSAKLAPDAQSATVTLLDAGGIGLRYILTADLRALDPARTEVNIYVATRSSTQEAILWRQWANTPLDTGNSDPNGVARASCP